MEIFLFSEWQTSGVLRTVQGPNEFRTGPPRSGAVSGGDKLATNPLVKYKIKNHLISDDPSSKSNKAKCKIKEP